MFGGLHFPAPWDHLIDQLLFAVLFAEVALHHPTKFTRRFCAVFAVLHGGLALYWLGQGLGL